MPSRKSFLKIAMPTLIPSSLRRRRTQGYHIAPEAQTPLYQYFDVHSGGLFSFGRLDGAVKWRGAGEGRVGVLQGVQREEDPEQVEEGEIHVAGAN